MHDIPRPLTQADAQRVLTVGQLGADLLNLEPLLGGLSATVQKMTYLTPTGQRASAVIRCHSDIDFARNPHLAADEFELVSTLHAQHHLVPKPLYLERDAHLMGRPFVVYEFVEGHLVSDAQGLANRVKALALWLANLHNRSADSYDLAGLSRLDPPPRQALKAPGSTLDPEIFEADIRSFLDRVSAPVSVAPNVVLHGDFWSGNVVWRDEEIAAVIDWEDFAVGDPLADLACARLELFWGAGWRAMEAFTTHYQSAFRWGEVAPHALAYWDLCAVLPFAHTLSDMAPNFAQRREHRDRLRQFVQKAARCL